MVKILFSANKDIKKFIDENGISSVVYAEQVHGGEAEIVDFSHIGEKIKGKDALVTKERDLYLSIAVADCLPVFLWNESGGVVALAHAGWRGLCSGIIENTLFKMKELSDEAISAYIGPGIGKCHFEVKGDVAEKFPRFTEKRNGKIFVNLKAVAREDLQKGGVKNIEISDECTYCSDNCFSYRRDGGSERMFAFIKVN